MKKLSTAPIMPALRSSLSELRMLSAWLPTIRIWRPWNCGSARAFSTASMTRSATSTTLACVALNTSMPTAGLPSMRRPTVSSGATISTWAMSASRTFCADQQVADVVDIAEHADRAHGEARVVLSDLAGAHREVGLGQGLPQLAHVDVVGREAGGVDQDADLARLHAFEFHARHALDPLHRALQVLLQHLVLVGEVAVGRDADHGDGLVTRAEREHQQAVGALRQLRPDRVELGADVERSRVGVAVPVEQHGEGGLVRLRARADLLDTRRAWRALPRPGAPPVLPFPPASSRRTAR